MHCFVMCIEKKEQALFVCFPPLFPIRVYVQYIVGVDSFAKNALCLFWTGKRVKKRALESKIAAASLPCT